jgi:DNA recombination protein RmuC
VTTAILLLVVVAVALLLALLLRRSDRAAGPLLQQQLIELRGRLDGLLAAQQTVPQALADGRAEQARSLASQFLQLQSALTRQLADAGTAVADVRERLGLLAAATQRLESVGQSVAKVQELLQVPRLRGTLGEVWLEELLRQVFPAGLYRTQHTFRSGEKVDAVIVVGDRLIPVDAKFPLEACQRMLAADAATLDRERRAFRRSLRERVDEIADKYIRPDEGTFEFALMYIPAENVFYEAVVRGETLEEDDSVVGYALRRKVIPVSPHTFYAYLAAILHGLRGLEVEAQAREILDALGGLQQQFARFEEAHRLVGTHLERAVRQYGEADKQLGRIRERFTTITGVTGGGGPAADEGTLLPPADAGSVPPAPWTGRPGAGPSVAPR